MKKNPPSLGRIPEYAIKPAPEDAAKALTQAEQDARTRLSAIAIAMATARAELEARVKT